MSDEKKLGHGESARTAAIDIAREFVEAEWSGSQPASASQTVTWGDIESRASEQFDRRAQFERQREQFESKPAAQEPQPVSVDELAARIKALTTVELAAVSTLVISEEIRRGGVGPFRDDYEVDDDA